MRLILFRGKKADGEWVYGDLIKYLEPDREYGIWTDSDGIGIVIPETVGQFTGLLDKNGAKIFEGDILKRNILHIATGEILGDMKAYVIYENDQFKLMWEDKSKTGLFNLLSRFEVIGNIHDNPGLL